jgi:hypothetical protein
VKKEGVWNWLRIVSVAGFGISDVGTSGHTVTMFVMPLNPDIRGPFAKFVDWRQCAAVMQQEEVTCQVVVVGVT